MGLPFYQVDAFSAIPFAGNPAAVVLLTEWQDASWMQAVAAEMNLAETAFILPIGRGYAIRYFTPTVEVPACGHATLSCAHILWEIGSVPADQPVVFRTIADVELTCVREADGLFRGPSGGPFRGLSQGPFRGLIRMIYPADPPAPVEPEDIPAGLIEALGVEPIAVSRSSLDWLVELAHEDAVIATAPDFRAPALLEIGRGVMVTARSNAEGETSGGEDNSGGGGIDFVSRFFAPAAGIDEDPVTGSAHTALGPYWAARLGKNRLLAYQASARGGQVLVTVHNDHVEIAGHAVTVVRGELIT